MDRRSFTSRLIGGFAAAVGLTKIANPEKQMPALVIPDKCWLPFRGRWKDGTQMTKRETYMRYGESSIEVSVPVPTKIGIPWYPPQNVRMIADTDFIPTPVDRVVEQHMLTLQKINGKLMYVVEQ